ncbi:MAG: hypothetical protein Q7P63_17855 [Verrucomicrobiota bacterium JB022]|nr:hypothetical protein [Verrucomicrobiota bacterium JB022]
MMAKRLALAATVFLGIAGSLPGVTLYIEPRTDSPEVIDVSLPSRQVRLTDDSPLDVPRGWVGAVYEGPWYGYISATTLNTTTGMPRPGTRVQLEPNSQLPPIATVLEGDQVEVIDGNQWWTRIKLSKPVYVYYPAQEEAEAQKEGRKLAFFSLPWGKKEEQAPAREARPEPKKVTIMVDGVQKEVAPGQSIGYNPRGVAEEIAEMRGTSNGSGAPRSPDGSGPSFNLNPNQPDEPLLVYNSPLNEEPAPQPAPVTPRATPAPVASPTPASPSRQQVQPARDDFFVLPASTVEEASATTPARPPRAQVVEVTEPVMDENNTTPPPASITALDAPPPSAPRSTTRSSTFQPQQPQPATASRPAPAAPAPQPVTPVAQPSRQPQAAPAPVAQPEPRPAAGEVQRVREIQPRIFASPAPQSGPIARNQKVRVAPPVPDPYPVNREEPRLQPATGEIHDTFHGKLVPSSRKWYALRYPKYAFELQSESGKRIAFVDISGVLIQGTVNEYTNQPVEVYGLWDTTDEEGIVIRARNMRLMAP